MKHVDLTEFSAQLPTFNAIVQAELSSSAPLL